MYISDRNYARKYLTYLIRGLIQNRKGTNYDFDVAWDATTGIATLSIDPSGDNHQYTVNQSGFFTYGDLDFLPQSYKSIARFANVNTGNLISDRNMARKYLTYACMTILQDRSDVERDFSVSWNATTNEATLTIDPAGTPHVITINQIGKMTYQTITYNPDMWRNVLGYAGVLS